MIFLLCLGSATERPTAEEKRPCTAASLSAARDSTRAETDAFVSVCEREGGRERGRESVSLIVTVITCCLSTSLRYCSSLTFCWDSWNLLLTLTSLKTPQHWSWCDNTAHMYNDNHRDIWCWMLSCEEQGWVLYVFVGCWCDLSALSLSHSCFLCSPLHWEVYARPLCGPQHLSVWSGLGRARLLQRWVLQLPSSVSLTVSSWVYNCLQSVTEHIQNQLLLLCRDHFSSSSIQ